MDKNLEVLTNKGFKSCKNNSISQLITSNLTYRAMSSYKKYKS